MNKILYRALFGGSVKRGISDVSITARDLLEQSDGRYDVTQANGILWTSVHKIEKNILLFDSFGQGINVVRATINDETIHVDSIFHPHGKDVTMEWCDEIQYNPDKPKQQEECEMELGQQTGSIIKLEVDGQPVVKGWASRLLSFFAEIAESQEKTLTLEDAAQTADGVYLSDMMLTRAAWQGEADLIPHTFYYRQLDHGGKHFKPTKDDLIVKNWNFETQDGDTWSVYDWQDSRFKFNYSGTPDLTLEFKGATYALLKSEPFVITVPYDSGKVSAQYADGRIRIQTDSASTAYKIGRLQKVTFSGSQSAIVLYLQQEELQEELHTDSGRKNKPPSSTGLAATIGKAVNMIRGTRRRSQRRRVASTAVATSLPATFEQVGTFPHCEVYAVTVGQLELLTVRHVVSVKLHQDKATGEIMELVE